MEQVRKKIIADSRFTAETFNNFRFLGYKSITIVLLQTFVNKYFILITIFFLKEHFAEMKMGILRNFPSKRCLLCTDLHLESTDDRSNTLISFL